jgi:ribosome recycling factor
MTYDFNLFKKNAKSVEEWLKKELVLVRTGRANPEVLDSVLVEAYGTPTPIQQIGSVMVEDARSVRVSVWDTALIKETEKAINVANLGVSLSVDEKGLRVIFPELTGERRLEFVKIAKEKLEQARVSLRKHRDECWNDIQAKEKLGGMSEDEKFRFKAEMEKITQDTNKNLEDIFEKKEKEIIG